MLGEVAGQLRPRELRRGQQVEDARRDLPVRAQDVLRAQCLQPREPLGRGGARDDLHLRRDRAQHTQGAFGHLGVVVRDDDRAGRVDAQVPQQPRAGVVRDQDRCAAPLEFTRAVRTAGEHRVRLPGAAQRARGQAGVRAVPQEHHAARDRQAMRAVPVPLPAGGPGTCGPRASCPRARSPGGRGGQPGQQRSAQRRQGRGQRHQQHRRGDEHPRTLLAQPGETQAQGRAGRGEHERELPDLPGQQRHGQRRAPVLAQQPHAEGRHHDLQQRDQRRRAQHQPQVSQHEPQVQLHPHRQEERRAEQDLEGEDLTHRLRAVAALADEQARQERPQRQTHARQRRQAGRAEAQRHDRQQEDLRAARPRHDLHQGRHHPPRRDEHQRDDPPRLRQRDQHARRAAPLPGQHGNQQHHQHHRQILEDQDAQTDLPGAGVRLAPLAEQFHHDRGARQGQQAPGEHRVRRAHPEGQQRTRRRQDGQAHLQPPTQEDQPRDPRQALQAELDPDGEQQQHHPDLRRRRDQLRIPDEAQRAGTHQHPRQQKADDRQQPQPERPVRRRRRHDQQQRQLHQKGGRSRVRRLRTCSLGARRAQQCQRPPHPPNRHAPA